jgi:quinol-cytochrome oxidoreductase complex cytochrome b subunit
VRGLHYFGASFIVIAAVIPMLRVVWFGSYKKPREVTWITGLVLLFSSWRSRISEIPS